MGTQSSAASPVVKQFHSELQSGQPRWNPITRVAFRFLFGFFGLMCINILLVVVQITIYFTTGKPPAGGFVETAWRAVVPWFGHHVLRLQGNINFNGRGDSAFDWVMIAFCLLVSALAAVVWTALDRKRLHYARLHQWLRLAVRMSLAGAMIIYGTDKVFPLQFGTLGLSRLSTSIGNLDPEGMLWAFMAASTGYTIFGGLGEVISAVLLIIPRLAKLGALVAIGVMTNVFALNIFYNVPVKIYSGLYLLMGIFLIAPDLRRLADVLVFNRAVQPVSYPALFGSPRWNRTAWVAQLVLGFGFLLVCLNATHGLYVKRQQAMQMKSPLYGIWTVNEFTAAGAPPAITGEKQWHRLIFEHPGSVAIESNGGEDHQVKAELDAKQNLLTLTGPGKPPSKATLRFERPQPSELILDGEIDGSKVHATLHRVDETKFPLTSTGTHWVQ